MKTELLALIDKLSDIKLKEANVIDWACPILSFGDLLTSKVATLGLNPSNREFIDSYGNELNNNFRRFHTLKSLGISNWSEIKKDQLDLILDLCKNYFFKNPYDSWFKRLDNIISGTTNSYYSTSNRACHLDLIPFATFSKWTDLTSNQKTYLFDVTGETLGQLLKKSPVELLILNGQTVVDNLERITNVELYKKQMPQWTLPRKSGDGVIGYSYVGIVEFFGNVKLNNPISILGYNHNIQSSFGVTKEVQSSIRNWITKFSKRNIYETC